MSQDEMCILIKRKHMNSVAPAASYHREKFLQNAVKIESFVKEEHKSYVSNMVIEHLI